MPNQSSHAHHVPIRTCVICKKKIDQNILLNFYIVNSDFVFDLKRSVNKRKYYICHSEDCLKQLNKWQSKLQRRTKRTKTDGYDGK